MNRLLVACLISCLVLLAAADEADVRRLFEGRHAAMKTALAQRDANALSSLLSPGFVSTDVSGHTENTTELIAGLKKLPVDRMPPL